MCANMAAVCCYSATVWVSLLTIEPCFVFGNIIILVTTRFKPKAKLASMLRYPCGYICEFTIWIKSGGMS